MTNKELIKQIKKEEPKTNVQGFENIHPKLLNKIYIARQVYKNSKPEDFEFWLKHQEFYSGGLSLNIIAYILGITRERVRQVETMALAKLRHPKINKKLREQR